jgi:asparagine synthase (glutamine-hydrolysing)
MSAIVGILYLDSRPVQRNELLKMLDTIPHRGMDDVQLWTQANVALGHRMLRTTPESVHERLPFTDSTNGLTITADARLDNRDELIDALNLPASESPPADSELILASYLRWGDRCPERLLGDFAFAIWDPRTQSLFCVRDHFGVRPFYYHLSSSLFAFATEIKALFAHDDVPRRLNELRVADHLAGVFQDNRSTFYLDVLRLPPGHTFTLVNGNAQLRSYWSLDRSRQITLKSDAEYAEAFRERFVEAVRVRLRSASSVGCMLSGGLDSSSIACVARNLLNQAGADRLSTFSTCFEQVPSCDERNYIETVLSQNGVKPHYIKGDAHGPLRDLSKIHWHQDQPFFAPNFAMVWSIYKAVSEQGIRVLLDGHDGDSVVSHGYDYLRELALAGKWILLARELRGLGKHYGDSSFGLFQAYFAAYGVNPVIKKYGPLRVARRASRAILRKIRPAAHSSGADRDWQSLMNPAFAERVAMTERHRAFRKTLGYSARTEHEAHYRTLAQAVQPFALEVHNGAAAAFGIETRYPFWDRRVVEFCLALPPGQKLHRGWTRMVLRRAMGGVLPTEVQWRGGKLDFTPSLSYGLRTYDQPQLEQIIVKDPSAIEQYINIDTLRETYQRLLTDDEVSFHDVFNIWKSVSLAIWLRDNPSTL